jgi:hypothetical protein
MLFSGSQFAPTKSKAHPIQRLRTLRLVHHALARQQKELNLVKRESWTEADLGNLPEGEPDVFDRKSGQLFSTRDNFFNSVAKSLSAFANSGGGSLILGVADDGTPDGLPPREGKTSTREWLEQKIPSLLDYPLADFRVHTVIRDGNSTIPGDKEVIVIDVGDSAAAPHQSTRDKIYYRREGGHSKPAPHFYLELLRQRLTNPVLEFELKGVEQLSATQYDGGIAISGNLIFSLRNIGRVAAYEWQLNERALENKNDGANARLRKDLRFERYPTGLPQAGTMPTSRSILPGCTYREMKPIGLLLRPASKTPFAVREELQKLLQPLTVYYQLATETSPGEQVPVSIGATIDIEYILSFIERYCADFFSRR